MDPITIGLIASGVLGLGGGLLNYFGAKKQSETNRQIASQNVQSQMSENEITRMREDNAVQRRAADLEAAGISKYLAAGSAASSQAMTAPKNEFQAQNLGAAAVQGISQGAQVAQQVANVQNTVAQTKAQQLANDTYMEKHFTDMNYKKALTEDAQASAEIKKIEGKYKAQEIEAKIDSIIEGILKSMSDRMVNESVIEVNAQKIVESVAKTTNLNQSTRKLVSEVALNRLKMKAEEHNLAYAKEYGIPTTGLGGGLAGLGMGLTTAGNNLFKGLKSMVGL